MTRWGLMPIHLYLHGAFAPRFRGAVARASDGDIRAPVLFAEGPVDASPAPASKRVTLLDARHPIALTGGLRRV